MAIQNRFLKAGILWAIAAVAFAVSALLQDENTGIKLIPAGFAAALSVLNLLRHRSAKAH